MITLLEQIKSPDNALRKEAETKVTTLRASNARALYDGLLSVIAATGATD